MVVFLITFMASISLIIYLIKVRVYRLYLKEINSDREKLHFGDTYSKDKERGVPLWKRFESNKALGTFPHPESFWILFPSLAKHRHKKKTQKAIQLEGELIIILVLFYISVFILSGLTINFLVF